MYILCENGIEIEIFAKKISVLSTKCNTQLLITKMDNIKLIRTQTTPGNQVLCINILYKIVVIKK